MSRFAKIDPPGPIRCVKCGQLKEQACFQRVRSNGTRRSTCKECIYARRKELKEEREIRSDHSKPRMQQRVVRSYKQWLETWRKRESTD